MKGILAALALGLPLPMAATAADFDYSYADLAYSRVSSEAVRPGFAKHGDGYRVDGSYGLGQHWFLDGSYQRDQFDFPGGFSFPPFLRLTRWQLGGGFHMAVMDDLDFVTHLDYGRARSQEYIASSFSYIAGNDGYQAGAELRFQATPELELDAGIDHDDLAFDDACSTFFGNCAFPPSQGGVEDVLSAAARLRIGAMGAGIEYRRSSLRGGQGWLLSLRATF